MKKRWSSCLLNTVLRTLGCSSLIVFNIANAWAQQPQNDYYSSHMMWNGGWYGMLFGPFLMILYIGIGVAVVVFVVRWLSGSTLGHNPSTSSVRDPLDILKERFAQGEIEKEEYEERRQVLLE